MNRIMILSLAVLTAGCMAEGPVEPSARVETRLAEELRGRVAGETVECVNQRDLVGNRTIAEEVIIFRGRSNLVYVNRPPAGCPGLEHGRALMVRHPSTRLCRGDIVSVFDPLNGNEFGGCSLGDFTPYRRVR